MGNKIKVTKTKTKAAKTKAAQRLRDLKGFGPKSEEILATVGIHSVAQFMAIDPYDLYAELKQAASQAKAEFETQDDAQGDVQGKKPQGNGSQSNPKARDPKARDLRALALIPFMRSLVRKKMCLGWRWRKPEKWKF